MGQTGSKGQAKPSSSLHLRDKKDLAGVGVIFRKNPEGLLVVKDVVGGSSADESGLIEPGDCLTQVDDVKVAKSSIADISGMVLGTPGESVKLKFTRTVGKSKKKYKVVLKRTVRASLEPTYHVQRDGINTKVTHIHLDCLQNQDSELAAAPAAVNEARDVLDADGNVVGPGLLQRARTANAGMSIPGVERIDSSHPAWPGAKKKQANTKQGSHSSTPKPMTPALEVQSPAAVQPPAAAVGGATSLLDDVMVESQAIGGTDMSSFMDSFAAADHADTLTAQEEPVPDPAPPLNELAVEEPAVIRFEEQQLPAAAPDPPAPAPAIEPVLVVEEEEDNDPNVPDWEGLAQSRLAVFEAKAREHKPSKNKSVDLEKEWARSAAVAAAPGAGAHSLYPKPQTPNPKPQTPNRSVAGVAAAGAGVRQGRGPRMEGVGSLRPLRRR